MATIGVMDSGSGGLSVLRELIKALPGERYVYWSDNAFCPYGDKDPEFILQRCKDITEYMLSKGVDAMVLACNTATAAAIAQLREEYSIPFVGMEPAVKPAALGTRTGTIGVLATSGTLKGSKYLRTKDKIDPEIHVVEAVGKGFVELVENGELSGPHAEEVVSASLLPLLDAGADMVVLGCTHYPFLLDTLKKVAGEGVEFIDPAPAVARRLVDVLDTQGIRLTKAPFAEVSLLSSGDPSTMRFLFGKYIENDYLCKLW